MQKSRIDWPFKPLYTSNPLIGCKNNCSYCYARKLNTRFKWIDEWTDPQPNWKEFDIDYSGKPKFIFIGSMSDLFGSWVPRNFIQDIINKIERYPIHQFIFLTKNPKRYSEFEFPSNVWLGVTVTDSDNKSDIQRLIDFNTPSHVNTFVSIEPLLGSWNRVYFPNYDLIIVGALTGIGASDPGIGLVKSVNHFNIYYKESIRKLYNIENKGTIYTL